MPAEKKAAFAPFRVAAIASSRVMKPLRSIVLGLVPIQATTLGRSRRAVSTMGNHRNVSRRSGTIKSGTKAKKVRRFDEDVDAKLSDGMAALVGKKRVERG